MWILDFGFSFGVLGFISRMGMAYGSAFLEGCFQRLETVCPSAYQDVVYSWPDWCLILSKVQIIWHYLSLPLSRYSWIGWEWLKYNS
jgi:hypothetical protein